MSNRMHVIYINT